MRYNCVVFRVIFMLRQPAAAVLPKGVMQSQYREKGEHIMPTLYEPLPEWLQDSLTEQVELELLRLHISRTMSGYHYAAYGVAQVIQSPEIINGLTKELYPEIAKQFQVRPANVERSIRVAIRACWERGGREALDEMAGIHLTKRPTNSAFLTIVADYIRPRIG